MARLAATLLCVDYNNSSLNLTKSNKKLPTVKFIISEKID
jgi:hypothetical protein